MLVSYIDDVIVVATTFRTPHSACSKTTRTTLWWQEEAEEVDGRSGRSFVAAIKAKVENKLVNVCFEINRD